MNPSRRLRIDPAVSRAQLEGRPVVALETAVVTHGLPAPVNLDAIRTMEHEITAAGAVPATCLIEDGSLWIGASRKQIERVACDPARQKASVRDVGECLARQVCAGLTVSATLLAAELAGIRVFATGGIGGVHRGAALTGDVSSDLVQLSRAPVITVCSGAKSVLDIPRTLEALETLGVPVFTYRASEFPAFYLRSSGLSTPALATPEEVAQVACAQWELGHRAALVLGNPLPAEEALAQDQWNLWFEMAHRSATENRVHGRDLTPYLLSRVAELSDGRTVRANVALLKNNARLAAAIAAALPS